MLNTYDTIILIIDIQEKLVNMLEKDTVSANAAKLVKAAKILDIPVLITEQYPKGLGTTLEPLRQEAPENTVFFEKTAFSALRSDGFKDILCGYNRKNILICGIEGHICVYQTAIDLLEEGYQVEVLRDITASRKDFELNTGIEKMKQAGAKISSLEITLFELLKSSKHPNFKEIQGLIK